MRILATLLVVGLVGTAFAAPDTKLKPKPKKVSKTSKTSKTTKARSTAASARQLINTLKTRRLTLNFKKASLDDFIKFVRAAVGINIVLQKAVISKEFDPDAVEISLRLDNIRVLDALKLAFEPLDLGMIVKGNVLFITTKKAARGKPVLYIYDISTLIMKIRDFPAPDINIYPSGYEAPEPDEPEIHQAMESSDEVAEMIRTFVAPDTWEDEGISMMVFKRQIFIRQYPAVQRQVARFIRQLDGLR